MRGSRIFFLGGGGVQGLVIVDNLYILDNLTMVFKNFEFSKVTGVHTPHPNYFLDLRKANEGIRIYMFCSLISKG